MRPSTPDIWDHPRSRGVYPGRPEPATRSGGSSPLARGLLGDGYDDLVKARIIPARAGFTGGAQLRGRRHRDHPRSRGVYTRASLASAGHTGSSPLARGLLSGEDEDVRHGGIIPARAGFTRSDQARPHHPRDHPRSRGVYPPTSRPQQTGPGSSPLARGLLNGNAEAAWAYRIIPARAGFTPRASVVLMRPPDHPRSRGVYGYQPGSLGMSRGSSPLARGLLRGRRGLSPAVRIIPARAGFTRRRGRLLLGRRDHPRSRGVYGGRG